MKPSRWVVIAAGVAAIVVLFLILQPGDDDEAAPSPSPTPTETASPTEEPSETASPSPTGEPTESPTESPNSDAVEIEIEVEDGEVTGPGEIEVAQGERVRIVVEADVSDEVHLHGYDLTADVTPQEPAVIVFRADAPGVYEVELENAGLVLLELSVVP
jgi:heme/copper-type cytochrome/quinol oxidase subunit 2